MPINYTVRADVVDIRTDAPQPTDEFLVDTNVWYWLVYTRASMGSNPPRTRQLTNYPGYVNQALANGSRIRQCGLTLSELAHRIEQTEREIYGHTTGVQPPPTKEFRHNLPTERSHVVSEVQTAWTQVGAMASSVDVIVNDAMTAAALMPTLKESPTHLLWSSYDSEADTLYINFKKPSHASDSDITDDDVIIRYEDGEVIGLTILHASTR